MKALPHFKPLELHDGI